MNRFIGLRVNEADKYFTKVADYEYNEMYEAMIEARKPKKKAKNDSDNEETQEGEPNSPARFLQARKKGTHVF